MDKNLENMHNRGHKIAIVKSMLQLKQIKSQVA